MTQRRHARYTMAAGILLAPVLLAAAAAPASGQDGRVVPRGTDNIEVLGHLPLGPRLSVADLDMEQEVSRPYAYVSRMVYGDVGPKGTDIIDISDPRNPRVLHRWRIENQDLHQRTGGMDVKHFKVGDRYYVVQSLQFGQGGPDPDLGAVVLDVTGLPDASTVREVARIWEPDHPGGFHNIFVYKHSDGRVLLFSTVSGPYAHVYDLGTVVSEERRRPEPTTADAAEGEVGGGGADETGEAGGGGADANEAGGGGADETGEAGGAGAGGAGAGAAMATTGGAGGASAAAAQEAWRDNWLVGRVPVPEDAEGSGPQRRGYHDFYAGYHPATGTDRFYGGGTGGYYIYDVTDLDTPALLTQVVGVAGVRSGHTFTPTPDGRYAVAETEYQYAPLRIFDLEPGLSGERPAIRQPIGAWTANWKHLAHNHEIRWPYVFVSGYLDGLQVFEMQDPENPQTVGYYDTYLGPPNDPDYRYPMFNGAFGVDVRNADGLIVVSDMSTGFWTFRMEGFGGWNGNDWGMPDVSSAQHWDDGPDRASASAPSPGGR